MKTKRAFNINGFEITARMCKLSDRLFILTLFKESIFTYISAFYTPSIEMFEERFQSDYNEKRILLRKSRRIGMFQLSKRNNKNPTFGCSSYPQHKCWGITDSLLSRIFGIKNLALKCGVFESQFKSRRRDFQ